MAAAVTHPIHQRPEASSVLTCKSIAVHAPPFLVDQVFVPEPRAFQSHHNRPHLVQRSQLAVVVSASKLVNVSVQVFVAHLVIRAVIAAFEQRPLRFDRVGRRTVLANVLAQ